MVAGSAQTDTTSAPSGSNYRAFAGDTANGLTNLNSAPIVGKSLGEGINNNGQVVGYGGTSNGETHAFVGDATNGFTDLGTLGGADSRAYDINQHGQITGLSQTADGGIYEPAFVGDAINGLTDLGTLYGRDSKSSSVGRAINDSGQVAGYSGNNKRTHAFIGDATNGLTNLATLGGDNSSLAIVLS